MLRLAFDFIITWRETRTRPNAYNYDIIFIFISNKYKQLVYKHLHRIFNSRKKYNSPEKITDLIGELALLNGKSREKNNPKGWIINALKGKIKDK